MSLFILLSALLVLIALMFVCLRIVRSQRKLALALVITLPLAVILLYRLVGTPQVFDPAATAQNQVAPDIDTAIANLQQELQRNPDNLEGWVLLARTQMAMENFAAAIGSYEKARTLAAKNPDLNAELAEAMMRASGTHAFPPEAIALLEQALEENPEHERALFYLGLHYLQQGNLAQSDVYLNKLLPKLDASAASALREQINIAREKQNMPALEPLPAEANSGKPELHIVVTLEKSLSALVKPGAVLFVFAKRIDGGGPPVAAKRIEITQFPIQIDLSDADSLMPTANLSSQEQVSVSARISMQGVANSQTGDIEADAIVIETNRKNPVQIELSRVKQ